VVWPLPPIGLQYIQTDQA